MTTSSPSTSASSASALRLIWAVGTVLCVVALLLVGWGMRRRPPPGPSVVLFTMDNVRKDMLGCYGSTWNATPTLDALAASGVVFEHVQTVAVHSAASHASMLTGRSPAEHELLDNTFVLRDDVETVAEAAQSAGAETAAFVSFGLLGPHVGLDRGFGHFEVNEVPNHDHQRVPLDVAQKTYAQAAEWIAQHPERFFIWVHAQNAHFDWQAPEPFASTYEDPVPDGWDDKLNCVYELNDKMTARAQADRSTTYTAEEQHYVASRYAAEVAVVDDGLRLLLDAVKQAGAAERTTFVVVADHGTTLLDRQGQEAVDHAVTFFDEVVDVPLLISGAGVDVNARGTRVTGWAQTTQLATTIEHVLGDGFGKRSALGTSLLPVTEAMQTAARPDHIWMYDTPNRAVLHDGYKLLMQMPSGVPRPPGARLFDLVHDPGETTNIIHKDAPHEKRARKMRKMARRHRAKLRAIVAAKGQRTLSPEVRALLEEGGYLPKQTPPPTSTPSSPASSNAAAAPSPAPSSRTP